MALTKLTQVKGSVIAFLRGLFTTKISSVFDTEAFSKLKEGQSVELLEYHAGSNVGGGRGVGAIARHNGGTAISSTRARPDWTVPAEVEAWFADSEEDELCFVRTSTSTRKPRLTDFGGMTSAHLTLMLTKYQTIVMDLAFTATESIQLSDSNTLEWVKGSDEGLVSWDFEGSLFMCADDNTFNNLKALGPEVRYAVEQPYGKKGLLISHPVVYECALIATGQNTTYSASSFDTLGGEIVIVNPVGVRAVAATVAIPLMALFYVKTVRSYGGSCPNYWFGVMYWGGDSNPSVDGVRSNQRKCDDIIIYGLNADNTVYAGCWGSMAVSATFINCSALRDTVGGDVGFDHEGTENGKNINCRASRWANGNYATFFQFTTNTCTDCDSFNEAGYPLYRNYNVQASAENSGDIFIDGGTWETLKYGTSLAMATIDDVNGCARSWQVTDKTKISDARVQIKSANTSNIYLDLSLYSSAAPSAATKLCEVILRKDGGNCNIKAKMKYIVADFPSGSYLVHVSSSPFNAPASAVVEDCLSLVANLQIGVAEIGGNGGVSGYYHLVNNIVPAITFDNSGAKALTIASDVNNRTVVGTAVTPVSV